MTTCQAIVEFLVHVSGEAIAATIGAFFGAGAAFLLQHSSEKKRREDKQYAALIQAQHGLLFMWRILASVKLSYLDPQRSFLDRHMRLGIFWKVNRYEKVDTKSITFAYGKDRRTYIANCFFAERSFLNSMAAIDERNQALVRIAGAEGGVVDPGSGLLAVPIDGNATNDFLLRKATEALFTTVDSSLTLLAMAFRDLRKTALAAMPGREFLKDDNVEVEFFKKSIASTATQTPPAI